VLVVDSASKVFYAQPVSPALKQNLYDVPMVNVIHFRPVQTFFILFRKYTLFPAKKEISD
jgi:hypothetical protein